MAEDARPLGVGLAARGRAQAAVYAMRAAEVYAAAADLAERYADALEVAAEHDRAGRKPLPATPSDDLRESLPAKGEPEGASNVSRYSLCPVAA